MENPLTSADTSVWLRAILVKHGVPPAELVKVGSHSLKATLLSWATKSGLKMGIRRLLGCRAKGKEKSTVTYSRDALAEPLRQLA